MRLAFEPLDGPIRHGWPTLLSITVENTGEDCLVLEETHGSPVSASFRWRSRPLGVIVYDAGRDRYRHLTHLNTRARIPLDSGILLPGSSSTTEVAVKILSAGDLHLDLTVHAWRLPVEELDTRLYARADARLQTVVGYVPIPQARAAAVDTPDWQLLAGSGIARVGGCDRLTWTERLEARVEPDADDPAAAALDRVGAGARLVQRCRRLRGAWVIEGPGGLRLVRGEDLQQLGRVDPAVWDHLDHDPPFEPVLVLLRGAAAAEVGQALSGTDRAQLSLQPSELGGLFAAARDAGLRIDWGPHNTVSEGLIVSG